MKRFLALMSLGAVLAAVVGIGLAQPDHPHMLVQRPVVEMVNGVPTLTGFRKCVDLAAGRTVPLHAHHAHIHTGTAGAALFENARHAVVPGAPLTPWANCAELEADLPFPVGP